MFQQVMRSYFVAVVMGVTLFTSVPAAVMAQSNADLQRQINELIEQIKRLQNRDTSGSVQTSGAAQGVAPEHTYTKLSGDATGKPKIVITAPVREEFDKSNPITDVVSFRWRADNVPSSPSQNYVVVIERERIKTFDYSGSLSGGTWQGELPPGDSTGQWKMSVAPSGNDDAGVYRVRARIHPCKDLRQNCGASVGTSIATSPWVQYTVVDNAAYSSSIGKPSVDLLIGATDASVISTHTFGGNVVDDGYVVEVRPSLGTYVKTCTLARIFSTGTVRDTYTFNKEISDRSSDFVRSSTYTVNSDGGLLKKLRVVCATKQGSVSDEVKVILVADKVGPKTARYYMTLNGEVEKIGTGSYLQAVTACRGFHKNSGAFTDDDVVECYYDDQVFERIDAWKG
jgi:hypothetical protein